MTPPRAILAVSNHGDVVGGGELSLLDLLAGLSRSKWTPHAVVPAEGEVARRCRAIELPVHVIPLPTLRRPCIQMLRSILAIRRVIRASGVDLLHANGSRAMFFAGLAGWLTGRPTIWHVRVADPEPVLDRVLASMAQAIIVNSDAVARRFSGGSLRKVHRIHNGVNLSRFNPRSTPPGLRSSLGISDSSPLVVSVGRFVPYKGYRHLVEAARLVENSMPGVHWILVGDGEQWQELEARCQSLGLQAQIHFPGWREDIPEILSACDIFVLPSLSEHFGRVVIEAMAMGKPVVVTDAGGVPEIVADGLCGLLVQPGQAAPLAEALLSLLRDPARRGRMGDAGRHRAEASFDLVRHVGAVESIYAALMGGDRGSM
jgi:glycosyltransferase involved in cell wall biosynthesis